MGYFKECIFYAFIFTAVFLIPYHLKIKLFVSRCKEDRIIFLADIKNAHEKSYIEEREERLNKTIFLNTYTTFIPFLAVIVFIPIITLIFGGLLHLLISELATLFSYVKLAQIINSIFDFPMVATAINVIFGSFLTLYFGFHLNDENYISPDLRIWFKYEFGSSSCQAREQTEVNAKSEKYENNVLYEKIKSFIQLNDNGLVIQLREMEKDVAIANLKNHSIEINNNIFKMDYSTEAILGAIIRIIIKKLKIIGINICMYFML